MTDNQLYPLKFEPILLDKIWGGSKLRTVLNKENASDLAGESWEISGYENNISVVKNGFLAGNNLEELIEVYMGDLVGDMVYEQFGNEFPLLIKFIDAEKVLSIQVHPDDELALERDHPRGKTEMWYILEAEKDAEIIVGFNKSIDKQIYLEKLKTNKLDEILNIEKSKSGDVFFLPAKRIHAIGAGNILAEIQQTSDLTYRIYDFDRKDQDGNLRELHTDLALDSIDFNTRKSFKTDYEKDLNKTNELVYCKYFTTNIINFDSIIVKDFQWLDSFIIYICVEGAVNINYNNECTSLKRGETILIPAFIRNYNLNPQPNCKLIEVYIDNKKKDI